MKEERKIAQELPDISPATEGNPLYIETIGRPGGLHSLNYKNDELLEDNEKPEITPGRKNQIPQR